VNLFYTNAITFFKGTDEVIQTTKTL